MLLKQWSLISMAYAITAFPNNIGYLGYTIGYTVLVDNEFIYYMSMFLAYINLCLNPFIYAFSHQAVKKQLFRKFLRIRPLPESTAGITMSVIPVREF